MLKNGKETFWMSPNFDMVRSIRHSSVTYSIFLVTSEGQRIHYRLYNGISQCIFTFKGVADNRQDTQRTRKPGLKDWIDCHGMYEGVLLYPALKMPSCVLRPQQQTTYGGQLQKNSAFIHALRETERSGLALGYGNLALVVHSGGDLEYPYRDLAGPSARRNWLPTLLISNRACRT
jgi:hypothetical protein